MTFKEAQAKADKMVIENRNQIYFIMGKDNSFDVFAGWDARDEALKNGYVFPRYSMDRHDYVTDYNHLTDIVE